MVNFYEIKQLIARVFGVRSIEDNDEDIIVELSNSRVSGGEEQQGSYSFIISNVELQELYTRVSEMQGDNLRLSTDYSYEVAIDLNYPISRDQEFPILSTDSTNGIQYELGYPTIEYCLYLIMQIKYKMNQQQGQNSRMMPLRLRGSIDRYLNSDNNLSLSDLLPRIIGEYSLKIKSTNEKPKSLKNFIGLKASFEFEFMYKTGISLTEYSDITDMFNIGRYIGGRRRDIASTNVVPLRKYNIDVVDYYKQAIASSDPYIKFISFYHVMEYFFDEVFKKKLTIELKDKLTHPDFSYKDDDKIYEFAYFVKRRLHANDETGQGNELDSLKYVLQEYINITELKEKICAINADLVQYYQKEKVSFCNAPVIGWNDNQGVFSHIAKRIYETRNSLVHSKSGRKKDRYSPYKDEKQLQLEIPLVKAIAELIIINSSEVL